MKTNLAAGQLNDQVPIYIRADFRISIFDFQADGPRIAPGGNLKVVFELALVAIIDEINPGIHAFVFHPGVRRHVRAPLFRVSTDEVVRLARQFVEPLDLCGSIRAHQSHAQDFRGLGLGDASLQPTFVWRRVVI